MNLKEELKNKRPNLSNGSLTTYNSILTSLYKNVFSNDGEIDVDKFNDTDKKPFRHILSLIYSVEIKTHFKKK